MKLGKCPICKGPIEIYKSLNVDDWKRYDLKCNTRGCLINGLEWNYEDKDKLVSLLKRSQKLSMIGIEIRPKYQAKKKELNTHYNHKERSACGHGERLTKEAKEVTCARCLNSRRFRGDFGLK